MKPGDVILYKGVDNLLQRCIKKVTKSEFVHCGVVISVVGDNVWTAEAYYNGFVKRFYYKGELQAMINLGNIVMKRPKVPIKDMISHVEKYLGIEYGFFQLIVILIKRYTGVTIHKNGLKKLICSEAVSRVLYDASGKKLDFQKEFEKGYDLITPADIGFSEQLRKI